ncbi:MAG: UvrD-helicase domain-containing protein [Leptospiraceae bacterium]|nr:UvrD-helicase domain-containing protein [Leptospiraceae bacterium]
MSSSVSSSPYDPAFLGSGQHRIIEASAGTGKTHFIEEQILYWLLMGAHLKGAAEPSVPEIHEILVLTFTEKATGELKIRIRQRLQRFLEEGTKSLFIQLPEGSDESSMMRRARRALQRFDSSCIFTIHGYCNHIIRTMGLAGDADFRIEQNPQFRQEAISEIIRRHLPQQLQEQLPLALSLAGFFDFRKSYFGEGFHFDQQLMALMEHIGEEGLPLDLTEGALSDAEEASTTSESDKSDQGSMDRSGHRNLSGRIARIRQMLLQLEELLLISLDTLHGLWDSSRKDYSQLQKNSELYEELLAVRKQIKSRNRTVSTDWQRAIWLLGRNLAAHPRDAAEFWPWLQEASLETRKALASDVDSPENLLSGDSGISGFCRTLLLAYNELEPLHSAFYEAFLELCSLQVDGILSEWKRSNRSLEFQDLLRYVDREVKGRPGLAKNLRERFPFAVIDEFQDTDPVQWSIFQNIYLVPHPGASITVVGDPKQSIYGFRGADISAYEMARRAIHKDGLEGRLGISFRTHQPLLDSFNRIFAHSAWFGEAYHSVESASDEQRKWKWAPESDPGPALEVHDLKDSSNQKQRMFETGRIIAGDIENMIGALDLLEGRQGNEKKRPLQYEDMAILVSRNKDSQLIQRVLRQHSIPCSIYKESGLYTSVPAYELLVLLNTLQDFHRHYHQLRLTSYFPVPVASVAKLQEAGSEHPVVQTMDYLRELALGGRWPEFFRGLLDRTFVLQKRETDHIYEDRISVTLQLLEEFSEFAISYRVSLEELIEYVQSSAYSSDPGLMRQKREKSGVSIMTIHASKGLQFPVVFSAMQFTGGANTPDILRYQSEQGMRLSLQKSEARVQRHTEERLAEDRRLGYVALTRAALKLFVFFVSDANKIHPFQKQVMAPVFGDFFSKPNPLSILRNAPSFGSHRKTKGTDAVSTSAESTFLSDVPELRTDFEKQELHSFSSLLRRGAPAGESRSLEEKLGELLGQTRSEDSAGGADSVGQESILPAGINFGLMVHSILEDLDFSWKAGNPELRKLVTKHALRYYPDRIADASFLEGIEGMVHNTMHTPVLDGWSLASIPETDRLAEMEFFAAENAESIASLSGVDLSSLSGIYLRGFVDLIFRKDQKYYVLDWKTNRIAAGYDRQSMAEEMLRHRYHIQAKIYFHALSAWLSSRMPGFDANSHLGGALYLFVRGMDSERPGHGIYHLGPEDLRSE